MGSVGRDESFTRRERSYLSSLPAVERVTSDRIYYTDAFKKECMRRYRAGESASHIFEEAGLPSRLIGYKRIERSVARWSKSIPDVEPTQSTASPVSSLAEMAAHIRSLEERLILLESRMETYGANAGECAGAVAMQQGGSAAQPAGR